MMRFLIADAWAQVGGGGGSSLFSFLPLVLIFGLFYFLLIRPQQKKKKEHKDMVAAMRVGDEVATNDGLLGKVTDLDDYFVTIDVAQGVSIESVNVQVQRHAIALMVPKGTFKELAGGGEKTSKGSSKRSKGSGKKSKASANDLSGQIVGTQSDNATDGDQSKKLTINGVEWKQWIRNLLLPFK